MLSANTVSIRVVHCNHHTRLSMPSDVLQLVNQSCGQVPGLHRFDQPTFQRPQPTRPLKVKKTGTSTVYGSIASPLFSNRDPGDSCKDPSSPDFHSSP
ncbi:hypothetical protein VFPPC_16831 [Pochonia chlamydosporia 170]|uniref:Uncharacterized protein n=1 Tax=Pochonia chlamydosporia 170 TaxID=1380566 RepID=A0A179F3P8_METCM|nr:hypothetical protein VFPPC_16831 [Pochonia chlamydosporia 170]OAQ60045.1 hypothetical protein VFPPC_16831 [Pochonia chlamydosporia 170]